MGKKVYKIIHGKDWDSIDDLVFDCPGCKHSHGVTIRDVNLNRLNPEDRKRYIENKKPRWAFNGDFKNPTFTPSIHICIMSRKKIKKTICHSHIKDGKIQFLTDCIHKLKGKTVKLPNISLS